MEFGALECIVMEGSAMECSAIGSRTMERRRVDWIGLQWHGESRGFPCSFLSTYFTRGSHSVSIRLQRFPCASFGFHLFAWVEHWHSLVFHWVLLMFIGFPLPIQWLPIVFHSFWLVSLFSIGFHCFSLIVFRNLYSIHAITALQSILFHWSLLISISNSKWMLMVSINILLFRIDFIGFSLIAIALSLISSVVQWNVVSWNATHWSGARQDPQQWSAGGLIAVECTRMDCIGL